MTNFRVRRRSSDLRPHHLYWQGMTQSRQSRRLATCGRRSVGLASRTERVQRRTAPRSCGDSAPSEWACRSAKTAPMAPRAARYCTITGCRFPSTFPALGPPRLASTQPLKGWTPTGGRAQTSEAAELVRFRSLQHRFTPRCTS
jgi:hypothetical protein